MKFSTRAIHKGQTKDPQSGAVTFPIYQTSTFGQKTPGHPPKFGGRDLSYARSENPTRTALEESLAALENANYGLAFCTGLAAVCCVLNTLKTGDKVVACSDLYGGSYRQFTKVYAKMGIEFVFINTTDLKEVESNINDASLLWLETPSNPLLNITDIKASTEIAKNKGVRSIVDNTFATPYLQSPLELGADIVLHSTTKYINGHADVVGGGLVTNDEGIWKELKFVQNACGLVPGPQDSYLVIRGMKTLSLRMEEHCKNAKAVAEFLQNHPKVSKVFYPGMESHPGFEIAKKQMRDFGAMLSFELTGSANAATKFLESIQLFTLAESLGCVQSLANHPASMTHASVEKHVRESVGITDGLIRLSIGIEDIEDICNDLSQALDAC